MCVRAPVCVCVLLFQQVFVFILYSGSGFRNEQIKHQENKILLVVELKVYPNTLNLLFIFFFFWPKPVIK